MIKIILNNDTKYNFEFKNLLQEAALKIFEILKIKKDAEISVSIVDNNKMRTLSNKYKKIDKPTDVLSFPAEWEELEKLIGYLLIGDIYISYEKVEEQAKKYGHGLKREWLYLFVHGFMHCLGYNHLTSRDEDEMNELVENVMNEINVLRDN